jgi:hypothetical protein
MRAMPSIVLSALALGASIPLAHAQGVSVNATITGQVVPGVYGQLMIGDRPPPPVVYAQPVVVEPAPVVVGAPPVEPIYLHVPPGHARNWRKHCHEYHACNRPVYFVRSEEYEPGYRPRHEEHEEHERRHEERWEHGHHHDDDHDRHHDD